MLPNIETHLNLSYLRATSLFVSKEASRGAIVDVNVRGLSLVRYVATNGHSGIMFHEQYDGSAFDVNIPASVIASIPKQVRAVNLRRIDEQWSILADSLTIAFTPSANDYPPIERVLRQAEKTNGEAAQFNPEYFATFAKAAKLIGQSPFFHIAHNGQNAALIRFFDVNALGFIMPMRMIFDVDDNEDLGSLPDWAKQ